VEEGSEAGWAAEAANGEDGETAPRAATLPIEAIRNHICNSSEINQQYLTFKFYTLLRIVARTARRAGSRRRCARWRYSCQAQPAAPASWWTPPLACYGHWCRNNTGVQYLTPYTGWHTLGYVQHAGSSPAGSCGPPWPPTSPRGVASASIAPEQK
jgi:hypothetical protein